MSFQQNYCDDLSLLVSSRVRTVDACDATVRVVVAEVERLNFRPLVRLAVAEVNRDWGCEEGDFSVASLVPSRPAK